MLLKTRYLRYGIDPDLVKLFRTSLWIRITFCNSPFGLVNRYSILFSAKLVPLRVTLKKQDLWKIISDAFSQARPQSFPHSSWNIIVISNDSEKSCAFIMQRHNKAIIFSILVIHATIQLAFKVKGFFIAADIDLDKIGRASCRERVSSPV